MNTIIKPVEDNYDKQNTYVVLNDKLTKAKEEGYYYEAMFIVYAMIEDRLSSILYYAKATIQSEKKVIFNPETEDIMKQIFYQEIKPKHHFNFNFNKISHKRQMLEALIKWSLRVTTESKLHEDIKKILKDTENYLLTLTELDEWCDYRNQLIHDIFNKNMQSVNDEINKQIDKGYKVARELINLANNARNRSKNI